MSITKILCPIDLSEISILGLKQASEIAKEHGAELVVMHVSSNFFPAGKESKEYTKLLDTFLEEVQELKRVVSDLQDVRSRTHHCLGNPAHEVVEFAKLESCDLIVLGSHGRSGFQKMILGSVADKVIKTAETNVLIVKDSGEERSFNFRCFGTQPVIIPFDFSDACVAAMQFAETLGIEAKRLHVMNVAEPPEPWKENGPSKQKRESELIAENRSRFYNGRCPESLREAEFRTFFDLDIAGKIGNVANEINASLIIMPTNQKNFLTRFFLGSVAETVSRISPCPTLIVKQNLDVSNVSQNADEFPLKNE